MKKVFKSIGNYILSNNAWAFLVLILFISVLMTNNTSPYSWKEYCWHILFLTIILIPLIAFELGRQAVKKWVSNGLYLLLWIFFFLTYPLLLAWNWQNWFINYPSLEENENFLLITAISILLVKMSFELNTYLKKKGKPVGWVKRISLDKAILLILFLFATILSLMAVSSLNNPKFHTEKQLLIGPILDSEKILQNFPTFLSFLFQFFLIYLAGYFFYFINHYLLVPKFLKERGLLFYLVGILGCISLFYPLIAQLLKSLPINILMGGIFPNNPFDFENAWAAFAIIMISLPVILVIQWFKQNNQISSLEKEKAETELHLLKQQINPHFFFNTLNNLYALSLTKSNKTPEVIMQLSELMRYVIYRGKEDQVMLGEEIKYLEDYIQLQQIRLQKQLDFKLEKDIENDMVGLPPLLLVVFVENAFKHGIEPAEQASLLYLHLHCTAKSLTFSCVNSFEENGGQTTGIGLENLKRRLELLFPTTHELSIIKQDGLFKAQLKLFFV